MNKATPTARMHVSPTIDPKTVAALTEMMTLAAKQFANYEGPIIIEILPSSEPPAPVSDNITLGIPF